MTQPQGFIVVLHGEIIEIPQDSYLSWLTMFYALPRELVEKRPAYLELPRNINRLFDDEKYLNMIEDDAFLELVWDCWACRCGSFSKSRTWTELITIFPETGRITPATFRCGGCRMKFSDTSAKSLRRRWTGVFSGCS